ncbi:tRNA wybutosine-synthesizing protein 3 homolog [Elysia marginata]|uniref:tRNA wybutosine-synthesizing protein 3 homolog n=1 Tax=Elysia marginata TaxID=1093978 RepID=A0AAV4H3H2_9GAST|nr:tRNA wybutosine-synthesizing protein 3 homolog [Elysia marginata]
MDFQRQKTQRLHHVDLSRKGSIDAPLQETVNFINSLPSYFTTSCCSGRIILFENVCSKIQKKGCRWLHVTHDSVHKKDLEAALTDISDEAVFKFEPMVMHVQCQTLEDARQMHQLAVASGFRNSGITVGGKGKIITAVRSTHSLEVPLSSKGQLLVSPQHLDYLVDSANRKMEENSLRINRFEANLQHLSSDKPEHKSGTSKQHRKSAKHEETSTKPDKSSPQESETKDTKDFYTSDSLSLFIFDNT